MTQLPLNFIKQLTQEISNLNSTYLEPLHFNQMPIEMQPLILELNKLFARLKFDFERNKHFMADTAHELRTPLAALKTQVQVALKTHEQTAQEAALQKVVAGVDRCSHVVTQLLTLNSLKEEQLLNDMHPFNLYQLTTEILAYLAPSALEKNIDIELIAPPKDCIIIGNSITLGILVRNLIDNAIRYTPPTGTVTLAIINQNNSILLRVTDSGPGISPEHHQRIFDRFYRIPGTLQTGSGLGLAIVKQIAELHHAQINLNTSQKNSGLQIDVIFPNSNKKIKNAGIDSD